MPERRAMADDQAFPRGQPGASPSKAPSTGLAGTLSRRLAGLGHRVWDDRAPGSALKTWGRSRLPAPVDRLLTEAWLTAAERAGEVLTSGNRVAAERLTAATRAGAVAYAVVGDSHSRILVRRDHRDDAWLLPAHRLHTGASARGLGAAASRSGTGERLRRDLEALFAVVPRVLVMFGQVDVEFVHPYRRFAAGRLAYEPAEMAAFLDETVDRYVAAMADRVAPADRSRVDIVSILPPALSDAAWRDGYRNAHIVALHGQADAPTDLKGLEIPAASVRTAAHAAFNGRLAQAAQASGFGYLDLFNPLLADDVVDPRHLGPAAGRDHHLDHHATRPVALQRLWSRLSVDPVGARGL